MSKTKAAAAGSALASRSKTRDDQWQTKIEVAKTARAQGAAARKGKATAFVTRGLGH